MTVRVSPAAASRFQEIALEHRAPSSLQRHVDAYREQGITDDQIETSLSRRFGFETGILADLPNLLEQEAAYHASRDAACE